MTTEWLPNTILRAASLIAPSHQRVEWLEEWRSELWYIPRHKATFFAMGAFRDALWLRRNNQRATTRLESPIMCLACLTALAAMALLVAIGLSIPLKLKPAFSHLRPRDLPIACVLTLILSCLLLPGTLAVWRAPAHCSPNRLRGVIFLALKIILVQPLLLCPLIIWILIAPFAPFAPVGILAACILTLRWVLTDQQQRCPVCLRLLTNSVRIGVSSETFLEWYGDESACSRGHGLLHTSEVAASYSRESQWLTLDSSWSGLK
jgi:hypothetical protein